MKIIKYKLLNEVNIGTKEKPNIIQSLHDVIIPYSVDGEIRAKNESYNGEITIEDDGQPEPGPTEADQLRTDVAELKEALNMIITGVTE